MQCNCCFNHCCERAASWVSGKCVPCAHHIMFTELEKVMKKNLAVTSEFPWGLHYNSCSRLWSVWVSILFFSSVMANAAVSVGSTGLGRRVWERVAERELLLQAVSARPAAAAACEWSRGRLGPQPSPARTGGASAAHVPAANLRPPLSASKLKPGTSGKDGSSATDIPTPRSKLSTSDGKGIVHSLVNFHFYSVNLYLYYRLDCLTNDQSIERFKVHPL